MQTAASFTIRRCEPPDAPQLSVLASRLFTDAYGSTHREPALSAYLSESFSVERLEGELRAPDVCLLIVEDGGGHPIGYAHLRVIDAPVPVPGRTPLEIVRFYLAAAWHGRGVAQALMTACEREAASRGGDALWLRVWQEAPRAVAFYARAGFLTVGTGTFTFGDQVDNDYIMAKSLGAGELRQHPFRGSGGSYGSHPGAR